jgi:glycosyltransferase involved in cell wall biosynthesis
MHIGIVASLIERGSGTAAHAELSGLLPALFADARSHRFTVFILKEDRPLYDFVRPPMELVTLEADFRSSGQSLAWHQVHLSALARDRGIEVLHLPTSARLLWRERCPLVATLDDLRPLRAGSGSWWRRLIWRRIARRVDRLIARSEGVAGEAAKACRVPRGRIAVVPEGLDHARFSPGSRDAARFAVLQRHNLSRPFFLCTGPAGRHGQNHERLLGAFEMFKAATHSDWQLVLAGGEGNCAGIPTVDAAIKKSPVALDIKCLGDPPPSDLPDLYRAAEGFVDAAVDATSAAGALQAMACACPVICSNTGTLAETAGSAAAGVEPTDVHSISRELYALSTDGAAQNRLRAAGLAQAQKFSWDRTAVETLRVYEAAARGR